ncbi:MCM21 Inner kinetochore subunit MCM21 [Candida maltosa Xu316]|uniref:Central kinetochore subunit MCM21 n=1 Tax=Candida maltosa (strain Xu316) TaxID=1245528 RepID=M3K4V1_CANMX|nr:hypothetical protein G210_4664 [Candida maltosa Xu316]
MNSLSDIERLNKEIEEIRADIATIETDISENRREKDELLQNIKDLEVQSSTPSQPDSPTSNEQAIDIEIPEVIKHNYFDPSIEAFFHQRPIDRKEKEMQSQDLVSKSRTIRRDKDLELKENILYENICRMFGVTAFPINQFLFDGSNMSIVGLRFDIFSNTTKTFVTPHYCILERLSLNKHGSTLYRWIIYKHTLPVFLQLDKYEGYLNETDDNPRNLWKFVEVIYSDLTKFQYRLDKLNQLLKFTKSQFGSLLEEPVFSKLDHDSQCQRISLLLNRPQKTEIELLCSAETVDVVNFIRFTNAEQEHLQVCKAILENTKLTDLIKNFKKVIDIFFRYQILE